MKAVKLITRCICALFLMGFTQIWANTDGDDIQTVTLNKTQGSTPNMEADSLVAVSEAKTSVVERTGSAGAVDLDHEPYLLLLEESQGLKEKLAEIDAQIINSKAQMDDLKQQIALKNDELAMLKNKSTTEIEKVSEAGGEGIAALTDDKSYKVIDGHIDENTLWGWKTYRGIGACTTCHGPTGLGGVGFNLLVTIKEKGNGFFKKIIIEGKKGTQMIPYKGNKAVMDNIDNIYAYFKARVDGVLGPENLIKYPLGKKE